MSRKFYITTPIYYVNARPHIGHAYTTIACDTIARRQRMLGADTFFLTGTDEHGQKIERAAEAAGKTPQQYADEISAEFRNLWKRMGISNDDFIRTTEDRHMKRVQELFRKIRDNGYIYKGTYTGQYCVSRRTLCGRRAARAILARLAGASPRRCTKRTISSSSRRFRTSCWSCTRIRNSFVRRRGAMR